MNKINYLSLLFIFILAGSCTAKKGSSRNSGGGNTYLLVHDAWHGAWCWKKLIPYLEDRGHKVVAIDLPSHGMDTLPPEEVTMDSYIERVGESLDRIDEKVEPARLS